MKRKIALLMTLCMMITLIAPYVPVYADEGTDLIYLEEDADDQGDIQDAFDFSDVTDERDDSEPGGSSEESTALVNQGFSEETNAKDSQNSSGSSDSKGATSSLSDSSETGGKTSDETETWDGNFTNEHPERGGIADVTISGEYGGTLTMEIPENTFREPVSIHADAKVLKVSALRNGLLDDSDSSLLQAVVTSSGKKLRNAENAKTKDILYNFYLLTVTFTNKRGYQVEPARTITFTGDTSSKPVNLSAANASIGTLEKNIYRVNPSDGKAEALWSLISLDTAKKVSGYAFKSDSCSSPFVLMLSETVPVEKDKEEEENGISTLASSGGVTWESGDVTVTYQDSVMTVSGSGTMKDYADRLYVPWNTYNNSVKTIVVDSGVKHIGAYCFDQFSNVTDVSLPNTLESIGSGAFNQCTGLTSVTIPDSVTTISDGAFADCSKLASITLGKKVETIDDYAFQGTAIKTLSIPASVKTIGFEICYSCSKLSSFTVASGNTKYSSSDGVLFDKNKTTLIRYPVAKTSTSYTIPKTVTAIADYAFYEAKNLKSITIPNSVKTIGDGSFAFCTALTSITIPDSVTYIGNSAFYGCTALKTAVIGSGVKTIDNYAFYGCTSLKNLTLSDGLVSILYRAFDNCPSLKSITLPDTVKDLDDEAFDDDSNVKVTLPAGIHRLETGMYVDADMVNITGKCLYSEAYKVLKQVNKERKAAGLSSLTMDKELLQAAMQRAAETNIRNSHNRPCGAVCATVSEKLSAENIAYGYTSAASVMKAWMNSSGHKANILDSDFQSIGIGCFTQGNTIYWVQIFSTEKATKVSQPSDGKDTFSVAVSPDVIDAELYIKPSDTSIKAGNSTKMRIGLIYTGDKSQEFYAELDNDSFKWSSSAAGKVNAKGTVTGLKKGTATVKAKTETGKYSASTKIKVKANYDASITKLKNKKEGIEITWSKAPSASGYYLYRKNGSGAYKKIKNIKKADKTSYVDTSVKSKKGTTYTYKIVGYSSSTKGKASTMKIMRLTNPKLSSVKNTSSKKMTVKWKKVSSVTGYEIQYSTSKTFASGNKKIKVKGASNVKKVISSLKKGKTYYVRIRSYKKDGSTTYYSAWSAKKSLKIKK